MGSVTPSRANDRAKSDAIAADRAMAIPRQHYLPLSTALEKVGLSVDGGHVRRTRQMISAGQRRAHSYSC